LAERHTLEFNGETARLEHAVAHVLGERAEVRVAGRELRPGVADPDHRAPVELVLRHPAVLHPAAVDETVDVLSPEPLRRPQFPLFLCHVSKSLFPRKCRTRLRWRTSSPRRRASTRARRSPPP